MHNPGPPSGSSRAFGIFQQPNVLASFIATRVGAGVGRCMCCLGSSDWIRE
ncbi:pilin glycosylation ligase domain-containing protein [Serratia proteamaculans]